MAQPCSALNSTGRPCGRRTHDDRGLCILHSHASKDTAAFVSAFMELLNDANMSGQPFDCTGFVFPDFDLPNDVEIRVASIFQYSVFGGIADFRKVLFDSKAAFRGAVFSGEARFGEYQLPRRTD